VEETRTEEPMGIALVSYGSFAVKTKIKKERERFNSPSYRVSY
jgi:hypothetical protein